MPDEHAQQFPGRQMRREVQLSAGGDLIAEQLRLLGADKDHPSGVVDIVAPISGVIADLLGMRAAIQVVAALTLLSGLHVAFRMRETHEVAKPKAETIPTPAARL